MSSWPGSRVDPRVAETRQAPGRIKSSCLSYPTPPQGWMAGRRGQRARRRGENIHAPPALDFERAHTMRKAMPKPLKDKSQGDSEVVCLILIGTEVLSSSVSIFSTADCVVTKIAFPQDRISIPSNTPSR